MQQPADQSVGQRIDIALVAGQYKIYCSAMAFDLPMQNVTYLLSTICYHGSYGT